MVQNFDKVRWKGINKEIERHEDFVRKNKSEPAFSKPLYSAEQIFEAIIKMLKRVKRNTYEVYKVTNYSK